MPWYYYGFITLAVLIVVFLVLSRTPYFRVRKYAVDMRQVVDKHQIQQKAEAVQSLGAEPNPMIARRPLKELTQAYQGLITDLEKMKVPAKAQDLHKDTIHMYKESVQLYQLAATGGFRQKALADRQKKLQQMEKALQGKMESIFGKPPSPDSWQAKLARFFAPKQKK
ncbi:MAG TPA: hypothetical protein VK191_08675 [Symbiobacteriaceae bacterium]|nr:hypothetical protein [Symbiobacteriaceae bacterium]